MFWGRNLIDLGCQSASVREEAGRRVSLRRSRKASRGWVWIMQSADELLVTIQPEDEQTFPVPNQQHTHTHTPNTRLGLIFGPSNIVIRTWIHGRISQALSTRTHGVDVYENRNIVVALARPEG